MNRVRSLCILIMFISLAIIGSMIKLPTAIGSIALDSASAIIAAAILGARCGAVVAGIGHLSSAFLAGFPLGLFHVLIAGEMGIIVYIFGLLYWKNWKNTAFSLFFAANAFIAPIPFIFLMGVPFVVSILPSLISGAIINLVVSIIIIPTLLRIKMFHSGKMWHA